MKKEEFSSLVWNYGASGTKEIEGYPQRVQDSVIECWSRIQSELDEDDDSFEVDSKKYINGHWLDTFYYVNYSEKDSEGYYTGVGGMVDYENNGITNQEDLAMSFETGEEAQKWIDEHKDEWIYGELSVM